MRGEGLADSADLPFTARFDYVYASAERLRLHGVQPPLAEEQMASLLNGKVQVGRARAKPLPVRCRLLPASVPALVVGASTAPPHACVAQLPNEWYPSDHLPVGVAFEWLPTPGADAKAVP